MWDWPHTSSSHSEPKIATQRRKDDAQGRRIDKVRFELNHVTEEFKLKLENRFKIRQDRRCTQ